MKLSKIFLVLIAVLVMTAPVYAGEAVVLFKAADGVSVSAAELENGGSAALAAAKISAAAAGGNIKDVYSALSQSNNQVFALVKSDTMTDSELVAALKLRDDVIAASTNYRIRILQPEPESSKQSVNIAKFNSQTSDFKLKLTSDTVNLPNDPSLDLCWGIKKIKAPEAWTVTTGNRDTYVALIDSGTYVHPDLEKNLSTDLAMSFGLDSESSTDWNIDHAPHGTHVAGTIAAVGNNNLGIAGVNWEASILPIRLYSEKESTFLSVLLKCIDYLVSVLNNHKDLKFAAVNMSLGGYRSDTPEEMKNNLDPLWVAFKTLDDLNRVVIVVGAGNDGLQVGAPAPFDEWEFFWTIEGSDEPNFHEGDYCYPASFTGLNNMIVVGSMASDDTAADSSCWGESVDIAAPGVSIFSTYAEPLLYKISSGTSMATPHVTGAAALLASKYPAATANQIKRALLAGADTNNNPLITPYYLSLYEELPFPVLWEMHEKMNLDGTERISRTGMLDVNAALEKLGEIIDEDNKANESENLKVDIDNFDDAPADARNITSGDIKAYGVKITSLDAELQSAVSNDTTKAVAVLPQLEPENDGTYYIKVAVNSNNTGTLRLFTGEGGTVDGAEFKNSGVKSASYSYDENAKFYDSSNNEITTLKSGTEAVIVATELEAGNTYTPVLSVQTASVSTKSSSSGCSLGFGGISALLICGMSLLILLAARVKIN